jgi:hypothetical protein
MHGCAHGLHDFGWEFIEANHGWLEGMRNSVNG